MKKSILPVFVLLVSLVSCEFISAAPAFAEAASEPVVILTPDNPTADTTIVAPDTPTTEAGSEWSGYIAEPAGTNIGEPAIPAEAPAPSAPVEVEATNIVTTTAPTAPISTVSATITRPESTAPTQTASTIESDNSRATNTAEATTDSAGTTTNSTDASTDSTGTTADSADAPSIEVPKTSFAERNRKITLMALISTALVFFTSIFVASAYSLFKLIRSERQQKEHESAVEETIRRHITRAE